MKKSYDLVLVDGSSYLYRAFFALPPLSNKDGEPTGAMFGVVNMLYKLMDDYPSEQIAVVFDAKGKTFRHEMYDQYKATRPPMPDDLRTQIEPLHKIIQTMGLPLIKTPNVEADDVIGTLAMQAKAEGKKVLISTGDKDMAQLVDEDIQLINTMNNVLMDAEGVVEKFGVRPDQIIDYLALMGDKSDNIPGVPKVGPKTAVKWLIAYDSAAGIIEKADEIKGKIGETLRDNIDMLKLSQSLTVIKTDVDKIEMENEGELRLTAIEPDVEELQQLFTQYSFKSLLKKLELGTLPGLASKQDSSQNLSQDISPDQDETEAGQSALSKTPTTVDYQTILDYKQFNQWLERLQSCEQFAFDTETTSIDYMQAEIVGLSFAIEPGEAAYVPLTHSYMDAPLQLNKKTVLGALKPLLESGEIKKSGHHLKYDAHILRHEGIELNGIGDDSMLASYVLNSTATRHDMDSVAGNYLGVDTIHYQDIAGKGKKQLTFDQISLEQAGPYAAEDADITLRLSQTLREQLEKIPELLSVYETIELPLVPVLTDMEHTGVVLDKQMLADLSHEFGETMHTLEQKAYKLVGHEFNLSSPKQLQEILFEQMELPVIRKTPKGQPSTAEDVLQELALDYELPKVIIEYRTISKLRSTYSEKLPTQIDADTGRVHTSYHQATAATGRLSSSDPNLQNIPIRTAEGRRIRQAFIAPKDFVLLAADYSQIELRIMAHLSQDESLLHAFNNDLDVHAATAAEVFDVALDKVSKDQRRSAKAINFGLIYGMSAFGLAKQLGIGRKEAQTYIDVYFERYPGVKRYMDETRLQAKEQGYVETVFGRRLYLPEINSRNHQRRQYAERSAINAPMQGTAADIIKLAMLNVHDYLSDKQDQAKLIMQVHDELVLEAHKKHLEKIQAKIIELMSDAAELSVPLRVDAGVGDNWDEAH
ncbi:MAG: DNA polymerase I [Gammaproteobacteria bacterium]|nr:DNA polymerase I [Gammaproteobacteria bacterium]NNM13780.1 DNA polymerase I [Gammaproteobacteria bacterium]